MEITLNNRIRVKDPPEIIKNLLIEKLLVDNPKFLEAEASGRSTWGINKNILNFATMPDGSFLVPRGIRQWLLKQAEEVLGPNNFTITDERTIFEYTEVDSSSIKYRPYQLEAVTNLVSGSPEGVLVAPAGCGKTVMGLSLIPLVGQPALWLTHTGTLAEQAKERAESFLPNIGEIGLFGRSEWKKGNFLTIGMIQTLIRNPEKLIKMRDEWGLVILDECLPKGTNILMLDGHLKDISEVKNGDVTTFGKVTHKFSRQTNELIELHGGWGKLSGTITHRLPVIKKGVLTKNKHTNTLNQPVEDNVIKSTMSEIEKGDLLLVKEDNCHTEKHTVGVRESRLLALISCGGHITKNLRCLQVGIIKDKEWFKNEMVNSLSFIKKRDLRISECARGDLIIREYSKEAVSFINKYVPAGKKHNLYVPIIMEHASYEDIKNYLQVVFDTEGGFNKNQITITMATQEFLVGVQHLLKKFGIISRVIPVKEIPGKKDHSRLAMSGYDAFLFYYKIGFSMKRKQNELFTIIKKAHKFVRRIVYNNITYRCMKVLAKKVVKEITTVYDFTTEDHFFIANGVLSSNCHHCPSRTFLEVLQHLNPYYMYGLTATPHRRDKLEMLMFQTLGETKTIIPIKKVEKYGGIIVPKIRCRAVISEQIDGNNIQEILKVIISNKKRNNMIVSDVIAEATAGHFCIVISDRRVHCETLYNLIHTKWKKTDIVTGKYNRKHINRQVDRYNKGEITVLVATFALLGEGFDVPFLDRAFIALPFRAEAKTEQLIGRIQRAYPGKKDAIVYDYIDINIGVLENQFSNRKKASRRRAYNRLGVEIEHY